MKRRTDSPSQSDIDATASHWIVRHDAGLAPTEVAEFQRWQDADPRHAEAVARKRQAWRTLERPLRSGQAEALLQRLNRRAAARRRRRWVAATAMSALLLVTTARFLSVERTPAVAIVDDPDDALVLTPQIRRLPDNTVVELRPGAELTEDFSPTLRRVVLTKGEAYFQVVKDAQRPFVVSAEGVDVQAVGTAFSVHLQSTAVEVLVTEGTVSVGALENGAPSASASTAIVDKTEAAAESSTSAPLPMQAGAPTGNCIARAGNRVIVDTTQRGVAWAPSPRLESVSEDEISQRLAWRAPRLEFSEVPLSEAVTLMSRYSKVQFTFADPALAELRVSGLFRADNVDTFVRLLEGTCAIAAERTGDTIRLTKAR